ncbi:MAG: AMP-binding protein [Lachnospiraceae bacterium]|nr:AMP-binding protein [Candidatus Hippenecus merdae]
MRLSFSTRGWADMDFESLIETADRMHFEGIEIYNLLRRPDLIGKGAAFDRYRVASTVRKLKDAKLSIPCMDTSCDLSAEDPTEELLALLAYAEDAQCPSVAVTCNFDKDSTVRERLEVLLPEAEKRSVMILIKTKGVYTDTERLRRLLDDFASDSLGALWDAHHTYRQAGESAGKTINNLGAYVKHVHLRDSDDAGNYNLIGEGTVPIREIVNALSSIDYDGFVSLEWKPEWMEDLTDREIIFPYFVTYMKRFENTRGKKKSLYWNFDGSGQYVWKKDELVDLTFSRVLDRMVEEFPDQYAFKYTTLDYTRTYEEFRRDVDDFAGALISLGVKPGSKVAVWATNVPEWFISFWAATKIGAVLVTMNTAYKIHEAEYLLRQSDTHTLIMIEKALDSDYRSIVNELCPEIASSVPGRPLHVKRLPFLRNVITVGFRQPGCLTFEEAMTEPSSCPERRSTAWPPKCGRTMCATSSIPPAPRAFPRASCSPTTMWSTTASASVTAWG